MVCLGERPEITGKGDSGENELKKLVSGALVEGSDVNIDTKKQKRRAESKMTVSDSEKPQAVLQKSGRGTERSPKKLTL